MLLLLKSPASAAAAATCSLGLGLSAVAGTTATLTLVAGLTPPESVELKVFVTPTLNLGLTAIPVGFLTRTAIASLQLSLAAAGGFGSPTNLSLLLGLSGTVGSTLQGTAIETLVLGLTSAGTNPAIGTLTAQLGLTGAPTISGGTVTPSASLPLVLSLAGVPVMVSTAICDLTTTLTGDGGSKVPNLARDMRLSFSSDETRLFFRKG